MNVIYIMSGDRNLVIRYMSQMPVGFGLTLLRWLGYIAAWAWALLAGVGGLGLIITLGPWPLTNGWFALFSGLSACPLTAWLLKKCTGIRFPGWARLVAAVLII